MRLRRILNRKVIISAVLTVSFLLAVLYAAAERDSFLRYSMFRIAYSIPLTKGWMLRQYSGFLDDHNNGNMGESIDAFLCSRLESDPGDSELAAVLEFYGLRAGGREGNRISKISDVAKQKSISLTLQRIDSYDTRQSQGSLLIVENMRRGETLYKGGFGPADDEWKQPNYDHDKWWNEKGRPEATARYKEWWSKEVAWSQKHQLDPLSNSRVLVTYIR